MSAARAQTAAAPPGAVAVASLAAPDLFSVGAPGAGLGNDLWSGSSGALARSSIPLLAPRTLSIAGMGLAGRLLSTAATGPEGAGNDPDLQAARLLDLLALGEAQTVAAIADRTPSLARNEAMARAAAEAFLVVGRADAACATLASLQTGREGLYWLRLRSFCLAQAGKPAEAQLAYDLAGQQAGTGGRPLSSPPGGAYARLIGVKLAGGGDPGPASATDALEYVLSRSLGLDLAPAMAGAAPAVQRAVAEDAAASAPARLAAAAYAMRLNIIPGGVARQDYLAGMNAVVAAPPSAASAQAPTSGMRRGRRAALRSPARNALSPAPGGLDVAAEARRFAALQAAPDPVAKAEALADLLGHAESVAAFAALARLAQPELDALAGAGAPGARGVLFASAAAAAADLPAAKTFRGRLAADGPDAVAPGDLALLDGLIAAASASAPGPVLDRLAERGAAGGDPRAAAKAQAAAAILLGLADLRASAPGGEARAAFARFSLNPAAAPPALTLALDAAADAGLKGDAALLALSVAQVSGNAGQGVPNRARIVRALARAGLRAEAAAFALEGLLELQRRP